MGRKRESVKTRFFRHVNITSNNQCWEWTGCKSYNGYGRMGGADYKADKKMLFAHRASWEIHNGPIPENMLVLHKCDNPSCVNPYHLEIGSGKKNIVDAYIRNRKKGKLTNTQVMEIRLLHGKESAALLAPKYGVNRRNINQIWSGSTWKFI